MTRAWWFEPAHGRLGYGDSRIPRKGRTHKVGTHTPLKLCGYGLHASKSPLDALGNAMSSNIWRVELSGPVKHGDDKVCAYERKYLWRLDANETLRHFARLCALDVADQWDVPDVALRWLRTGDESVRGAARWAEDSAADSASASAVYSAARSAAYWAEDSASASAARSAVYSAACSAVYSASASAVYSAAREKQSRRLHRMLMEAHRGEL